LSSRSFGPTSTRLFSRNKHYVERAIMLSVSVNTA
jgi:hypothetical protein